MNTMINEGEDAFVNLYSTDHNDNGNAMIDKTEENQKNEEKEPEKKEPLNVIHVSNLPWKVQEARLKEIFEKVTIYLTTFILFFIFSRSWHFIY